MAQSTPAEHPALSKLRDTDQTVADPDEDVRGRKIIDNDGEELGTVADLLIDDAERRVRFLVAKHGGVLGVGATESFIPVDAIAAVHSDHVTVSFNRTRVAGAPRYDPKLGAQPDFFSSLYGYYGFPPFWDDESRTGSFRSPPPL